MKPSPEDLEKFIHQTLRSLPARRAPHSLESRVRAAIESRAALPWWKRSFTQWPLPARVAFFIASAGVAKLAIMAVVWGMGDFDSATFASAFSTQLGWIQTVTAVFAGIGNFFETLYRSIPPLYLYGGLAIVAILYTALFGLGAAAYRMLYANR